MHTSSPFLAWSSAELSGEMNGKTHYRSRWPMMKRCVAGGGGEERRRRGGEGLVEGDSEETIFLCSGEPIKALCLQYRAPSAEKGGVFDFHRGGLSGMDGERSGWQTEEEMEGRREGGRCQ